MRNDGDSGWPESTALEKARDALGLSSTELYVRYVGVTGAASQASVDAYLLDVGPLLDAREHDKLVLALNECFLERGLPDRLPFHAP